MYKPSGCKGISKQVDKHIKEDGSISIYEYWLAKITKDERKKTKKVHSKRFPYTEDGFESAKKWIEQKSLEIQGEFSIYNKDKK